ncbi:MAG: ABC transporter substrate-binding protein [Acidobacteriota bacterium]
MSHIRFRSCFSSLFFIVALVSILLLAGGCGSREFRMGGLISLSGAAEPYGVMVTMGMDLAVEEVNGAGGVEGRKIVILYKDDSTNIGVGVTAAKELIIKERVPVIIGPIASSVSLAVAPICESYRKVMLSPASSTPKLTGAGMFIFRNYPSDVVEGTFTADFAREQGIEKVVVIAINNEFGNGIKDVFIKQFRSKFREILKVFSYQEETFDRFPAIIAETKELKPEAIYLCGYARDMAMLLKEIRNQKIESLIFCVSAVNRKMVDIAAGAAEGVMFPQPAFDLGSSEPAMASFVQRFRKKYSKDPDNFAAHGYDAVKLIAEAVKKVKSTHPEDIRTGLMAINNYEGAAGRTTFDNNGDVVQHPRIFVIHNGRFVQFDKYIQEVGSIKIPER